MFLVKRDYFNKTNIIKGFITALFLSAFIYLEYFDFTHKLVNTILGLAGIYFLLTIKRAELFYAGFFTAIFWFYWVGISFQYYDLIYLAPLIVIAFGLGYGILFFLCSIYDKIYFRLVAFFLLSFIHPFSFNWYIPELMFIDSYLPTSKEYFAVILASVFMFIELKKFRKVLAFIPLYFISTTPSIIIDNPNLKISQPQLMLEQRAKWNKDNKVNVIRENISHIDNAIYEEKDLVILPETTFPLVLNKDKYLLNLLKNKSLDISILAGALYYENGSYYNGTYLFKEGSFEVAKKVVLVPFGEKIPLPKFLVDFINNTFYNGAKDYEAALSPTDFEIDGIKFRNAICYEATSEELYQNLGDVKYMIASSNNAWFTPSIEPVLQKKLITYYARKYDITVIHSINGSENYIVRP